MLREPQLGEFPFSISDGETVGTAPVGPLLFLPLIFIQGGGAAMDLSRVGEKLLTSVRSARSIGLIPPSSNTERPEVPARAAAAAAVARVIAGLPPHQRLNLLSKSEELASIYGSRSNDETIEEIEEAFYDEGFDPVKFVLESIPSEESYVALCEEQATLRLAQLDKITERLSRHVMEHHEEMVKGMQLVTELEQDLKVANVICMNGRRHIADALQEVSRDLIVNSYSNRKQALLNLIPILAEISNALEMQRELDILVDAGNYCLAFQVLPEYLQVLENYPTLSAIQEMGICIEAWLEKTLQKLDALLLGVCQAFKKENYMIAIDAYSLIGDNSGLAEKVQSFFMQEVLSVTHSVLKDIVHEGFGDDVHENRLTYSDLCIQIPESKFWQCLLNTLERLFNLLCSYYAIMFFQPDEKDPTVNNSNYDSTQGNISQSITGCLQDSLLNDSSERSIHSGAIPICEERNDVLKASSDVSSSNYCDVNAYENMQSQTTESFHNPTTSFSTSPFYELRKETTAIVSHTLQRGRKNLWQLTTSRLSVLLSCPAVFSTSTYQFLRNYEDLNVFILAGEAFCGAEAVEIRQRLKLVCENYVHAFHRQNIHALKMVLEKESWVKISAEALQVINLAGLKGDGAPLIGPSSNKNSIAFVVHNRNLSVPVDFDQKKSGFAPWIKIENPFSSRLISSSSESPNSHIIPNGPRILTLADINAVEFLNNDKFSASNHHNSHMNGCNTLLENENEDLFADFIDEDSQLPSRVSKPICRRSDSCYFSDDEITGQTGSSLSVLRLMDKYARLMQKLEIASIEFFKGICQLFGIFFHFIFETFSQLDTNQSGKILPESLTPRLKMALTKIMQDCDQWIGSYNAITASMPVVGSISFTQMDVMPTIPCSSVHPHATQSQLGLKERCTGAETISLVARMLHRSKNHFHLMLLQRNVSTIDDFYRYLVDAVPDLTEHIHRTTARMLLHINGYVDKIANAKWEVKELGLEHNGYVDLLLGEYKHYKTRLVHGGISKEIQDLLLGYGLDHVVDVLIEGISRVKRCTDEGRVLMSLDLQVLINGLQHFVSINMKPKLQVVETFIKAYYLPETEYVHWARTHPEYSRSQIAGLINLVATMKAWKRKSRLEILERIEAAN